jgi:AcrR family transcriptional regulator
MQIISPRERILKAAQQLFAQRGYAAVSMRALAQAADLSPATLYHYFPNKEALLRELAFAIAERFMRRVEGIVEAPLEVTYKLERFCQAHLEVLLEDPAQAGIFLREAPQHLEEPERARFLALQQAYEQKLEAILQEGLHRNLFRDFEPRFMTISLLAALNATATWYQPGGPLAPAEVAEKLAAVFSHGLIRSW